MNLSKEPARIVSIVTAFATAALGLVAAFGLDVSDSQRNAIIGVIGPTVLMIGIAGEIIRSRVVSPATAGEAVAMAKREQPESRRVPSIRVNGYQDAVAAKLQRPETSLEFTKPPADGE